MISSLGSLLLLSSLALAHPDLLPRQTTTPDNTCGGSNGYICNANDQFGGACCSASGWCGRTDAYCGSGCQAKFSTNGKCSAAMTWQNHEEWTFTGSTVPAGLAVSTWSIPPDDPRAVEHLFTADNVKVRNGYLELIVPGGQSKSSPPLTGAEIATTVTNIKYASVKTTAILGDSAGSCNGMFFYFSGTQELDIEWLSDVNSESNPDGKRWMHFTNQDANGDGQKTYTTVAPPANPTTTEHEYRIDWLPDRVEYYVDGVLKYTTTTDLPSTPGSWLWNNWSSGNPGWTAGPPTKDNVFKIKKIVMDYNTA